MDIRLVILVLVISVQLAIAIPPLATQSDPLGLLEFDDSSKLERLPSLKSRLPTTSRPTNYKLEIQPILDDDPEIGTRFTAPGKINISITCTTDTALITFNTNTLTINFDSIKVTEGDASILVTSYTEVNETYAIRLGAPGLKAGREYNLYIEFVALVATNRYDGLYRSSYKDAAGIVRYLAATDFEADDARRAWPCFDEPDLKATWEISILRKDTYHSLSNSALESTVTLANGWIKDVYKKTEPLPTYLVAIAVSDYTNKSADPTLYPGKPVNIWGPKPMMDLGAGDYAADFSAKALQFFDIHLETPSKLLKMDKISLGNDFAAGAMENWGLNTYRESRILFLDGVSTVDEKIRMTTTLSHELAHQWFGNLVTMKWWSDIWLNEGFATYFAALGVHQVFPSYLAKETMTYNSVQYAMQADVLETTRPLSAPVENTGPQMDAMFDTLTYYKGASILRMIDSALPFGTLRRGLVKYLAKFSLGNADQDELFAVLQEQADIDGALPEGLTVKSIMDTWTLQSGYPVVQVLASADQLDLRQEKFFPIFPTPDPAVWSIPIAYYQAEEVPNLSTRHWLNETTAYRTTITPGKWVLVNPTQIGYYRVWYTTDLYNLLLAQLRDRDNFKLIDAQSRSALIDDSLNLGASGHYELAEALEVTRYMNKEQSLIPWVTLLTNMALPYRMFSRTASFSHFRKYMLQLIKNPLTAIKMEATPDEAVEITMLRTRLMEWACNFGDADCVSFAKSEFSKWMANPTNNPIAPDLRPTIYCTAMANGGDAEWNFIVSQYSVADIGSPSIYLPELARTTLIKALGCAKQTYRLAKLLDLTLNYQSELLPAHRVRAVQAVAGNSAGVELAFNFLKNNYATLLRRYGVGIISGTLSTLGNYMNTLHDFSDIDAFINAREELAGLDTTNKILTNYQWMSRVYSKMEPWMKTATAWPLT